MSSAALTLPSPRHAPAKILGPKGELGGGHLLTRNIWPSLGCRCQERRPRVRGRALQGIWSTVAVRKEKQGIPRCKLRARSPPKEPLPGRGCTIRSEASGTID